jgi:hypothetical protein
MPLEESFTDQKLLAIGGMPIRLGCPDPGFWRTVEGRYRNFYSTTTQKPEDTIDVDIIGHPKATSTLGGDTVISDLNGTVRMIRGNAVAEWQRDQRVCRVKQPESDFAPTVRYPEYGCDSMMRIILSFRFLDRDGLLLHASGLIREGKGYLFVGQSGAGKSTVARCSADLATVLSDDLVLTYLTKTGGRICGTPFVGEYAAAGVNLSAPLVGIYFLHQASHNRVVRVTPRDALRPLLRSVMYFGQEKASNQAVLDLALSFCEQIPCYNLHFLPDATFWRCIDAEPYPDSK